MESDINKNSIPEASFQDYLGVLLRGKWIILSAIVLATTLAIIYTQTAKPVYKSSASVLINTSMAQPSIFLDVLKRYGSEKNFTQNELEILSSKSLAGEVAERLLTRKYLDPAQTQLIPIILPSEEDSAFQKYASTGQIVNRLTTSVSFDEVPKTDVIAISVKSADPQEAALIANTIAEVYYDRNIAGSRAKSRSFREFLEMQLVDKKQSLLGAEDSLQVYMDKYGIVSLDDESKKLVDQLANLESQRDNIEVNIQSLTKLLASYQEEIPEQQKSAAKSIGDASDPYIRLLQEQIAKLEVQRDVTVAQNPGVSSKELYTSKISEIDEQINSLRSQLQKRTNEFLVNLLPGSQTGTETAGYLKQVIQKNLETKMELQSLQAKKNALNSVIANYESQFNKLPGKNIRYARLQRVKMSNEKLYTTIQEKYNEALMTEQSEFGYVEIIDRATVPNKTSNPPSMMILIAGVAFGFGLGIVVVFLRERLDVRVQKPEDLKKEGLIIRGTIMNLKKDIVSPETDPLLIMSEPFSPSAEAFKHLRTNLQYLQNGIQVKTILITSTKPGEGKTTIAANLSIAFAQLGIKVVAVDADMRKPSLHTYFLSAREPGITDYLMGNFPAHNIIRRTKVENLDFIGGGARTERTAELISSNRMKSLMEELKSIYDVVIFDSPPVLAGTEPTILSTLVDQVIMVVAASDTRLGELRRAVEELGEPQGKVPGFVLNKFNLYKAYGIPYGKSGYGYYPYASKGKG